MKIVLAAALTLLLMLFAIVVVVQAGGLLNFAGDEPHPRVIEGVIESARERFIRKRSADLEVPDLQDPALVASGAAHYVPMCAGCHLGPGTTDTEIRRGLYPQPPNLAQPAAPLTHDPGDGKTAARRQFWIIKHGIKMTAMPAWGTTHSDDEIWGLVAFLGKLPELPPEEFADLVDAARSPSGHAHATSPGDAPKQRQSPTAEPSHEHKH